MRTRLPADAAVDAEVDLCDNGGEYFLKARLNVSLPGIRREVAQGLGRCRAPDVSLFQVPHGGTSTSLSAWREPK